MKNWTDLWDKAWCEERDREGAANELKEKEKRCHFYNRNLKEHRVRELSTRRGEKKTMSSSSRRSGACVRCCLVLCAVASALCVSAPALYWRFNKTLASSKSSCPPCVCDCPPPLSLHNIAPGEPDPSLLFCTSVSPLWFTPLLIYAVLVAVNLGFFFSDISRILPLAFDSHVVILDLVAFDAIWRVCVRSLLNFKIRQESCDLLSNDSLRWWWWCLLMWFFIFIWIPIQDFQNCNCSELFPFFEFDFYLLELLF